MANAKRLISLDEALKETHNELYWTESQQAAVRSFLVKQPKVDAVEVVHGRWIRKGNEMKCSKCKFIYYSNHDDFNYCPNCGASMRGEEDA